MYCTYNVSILQYICASDIRYVIQCAAIIRIQKVSKEIPNFVKNKIDNQQSLAPALCIIRKDTRILIEEGKFFAINRNRAESYGRELGIFTSTKDLRLITLTDEATIDWMKVYQSQHYNVLEEYLDLENHLPVAYGAAVDSSFADNDGVAPTMVATLEVIVQEMAPMFKYDGWYIPDEKL